MKLSDRNKTIGEILGWKKNGDMVTPDGRYGYNTALTSCDREIDREALAKILMNIMYSGHQRWEYLHEDQRQQFEFEAAEIISTMPTWLKRIEG